MLGKTLSHYRIEEKVGAGAMGVVYRARDDRLGRDVAIKVLSEGLVADEEARKRLRREARSLSRLSHANVEILYDFDAHEGVDFLVMEFVEGEELGARVAGGLPEKEVARLGAQIAAALEAAHERGLVHRDLKPGNVLVTPKGQVKVLDFGLAKLLGGEDEPVSSDSLSASKAAAGTLPYMAPEQLRGRIDARSDLFAAGAVLYEMATGERPFPDPSGPELIDAILNRDPRPPSVLNHRVSPALEGVILKALEKDPDRRYQSATELRVDLERLAAPTSSATAVRGRAAGSRPAAVVVALAVLVALVYALWPDGGDRIETLAVLPLRNVSGEDRLEYFADGMTEALITELGAIGTIRVIGGRSVMRYKSTDKGLHDIAAELGVDALIDGSAQRLDGRAAIDIRLVHGRTEEQVWSRRFERDVTDVLAMQREIARSVAAGIELRLTPVARERLETARPVDPKAYDSYLIGRYFWNQRRPQAVDRAIELFQEAIEADPGYAEAHAGLADAYLVLAMNEMRRPADVLPRAKAAALAALELDPYLADAHASLGGILMTWDWDWAGAEAEFLRSIELNPSYPTARQWYGMLLYNAFGRGDEALVQASEARRLDPQSPLMKLAWGQSLHAVGREEEALEQLRGILDMDPEFPPVHTVLARHYIQRGRHGLAAAQIARSMVILGFITAEREVELNRVCAESGWEAFCELWLEEAEAREEEGYVSPVGKAVALTQLGRCEEAIDELYAACELRSPTLSSIAREAHWDPLRSYPRFQELLERMNLSR